MLRIEWMHALALSVRFQPVPRACLFFAVAACIGGCLELARSGVSASGPLKTPRSGGFWELRLKTFEPRFGGAETRVSRVLKSGQETSVSGF